MERQPRYVWLAEQLRRPIQRGEIAPGARLPSRTRLARRYRVSEQVSRAALRLLATEGVVEARRGAGYFVPDNPVGHHILRTDTGSVQGLGGLRREVVGTEQQRSQPPVSTRLRLRPDEPVYLTTARGMALDRPVALHLSWEPALITTGTLHTPFDAGPGQSPISRLEAVGHPVDGIVEEVCLRALKEIEADLMHATPGVPVLVVERTHYSRGRPVETSDLISTTDQCRLVYRLSLPRPRPPADAGPGA